MILLGALSVDGRVALPAQRGLPVLRVLCRWGGGWWSGGGQGHQPGVRGGDHIGPGPGWVDLEQAAAGGAHDPPGHGQDAQPQPFGFVGRDLRGQRQAGAPGEQIRGQRGDGQPDPILRRVVEREVAQPGVLTRSDASSTRAWRRWCSSRSASWRPGPPGAVLVRKPVIRIPSWSVMRSCAPGWGRSLRRISRVPAGQADRSTSSVSSATQAPSRSSIRGPLCPARGLVA